MFLFRLDIFENMLDLKYLTFDAPVFKIEIIICQVDASVTMNSTKKYLVDKLCSHEKHAILFKLHLP